MIWFFVEALSGPVLVLCVFAGGAIYGRAREAARWYRAVALIDGVGQSIILTAYQENDAHAQEITS